MKYALILLVLLAGCGESKSVEEAEYEFICNSCWLENGKRGYGFFHSFDTSSSPEIKPPTPCFPCKSDMTANLLEKVGKSVCDDLLHNRKVRRLYIKHMGPIGEYIYEHYYMKEHFDRQRRELDEMADKFAAEAEADTQELIRKWEEEDGKYMDEQGNYDVEKRLEEINKNLKKINEDNSNSN